jgi:hypothetical protein
MFNEVARPCAAKYFVWKFPSEDIHTVKGPYEVTKSGEFCFFGSSEAGRAGDAQSDFEAS